MRGSYSGWRHDASGFGYQRNSKLSRAKGFRPSRRESAMGGRGDVDGLHEASRIAPSEFDASKWAVGNGEASLQDLGSKNGSSVAGRPVRGTVQLADGDVITIGVVELTFRMLRPQVATENRVALARPARPRNS
jgi:hypothetical protein